MHLAERVRLLKGSATLAVTARANALRAEGVDVIGFGAGEPDFDTPEMVKAAAIASLEAGETKYAPTPGIPALRDVVAERMRTVNGIDCQGSDVVVTVGAKHAVFEVMQCLVEAGSEVVVLTPGWLSYRPMVELAGGTVVEVAGTIENGFKVDPDDLRKALNERTAAVVINSPCNPSGITYSPEEMEALGRVVMEHSEAMLVSDEIYEDLVYPEVDSSAARFSLASIPAMRDRTVTINGLSKAMAMTGWRIGWACAPGENGTLAKAMTRLQSHMTSGIPMFCMRAAITAVQLQPQESARMREVFAGRAQLVHELLSGIARFRCVPPSGAFYAFPDVSGCFGLKDADGRCIEDSAGFAEALLEGAGVAVVPGEDFGAVAANHVRISFACDEDTIRKGIGRIAEWVAGLR